MKNLKKLTAAVAATLMAATMVAPMAMNFSASAASLSLNAPIGLEIDTTADSVKAYKIFNSGTENTGGFAEGVNGDTIISTWSAYYTAADVVADTGKTKLEAINSADDVAKSLNTVAGNETAMKKFAEIALANIGTVTKVTGTYDATNKVVNFATIDDGYYAITCIAKKGDLTTTSTAMMTVIDDNANVVGKGVAKVGLPEAQKKVLENSAKGTAAGQAHFEESANGYNDIADYNIGDEVPFRLYGTLPENYNDYETYFYEFTDTLDSKFAMPKEITVTVDTTAYKFTKATDADTYAIAESETNKTDKIAITKNGDNGFKVTINDLKGLITEYKSGAVVKVDYEAQLTTNAVLGTSGQDNGVTLTYSNNPNQQGTGDRNTTPEDKVRVYTYGIDIEKEFYAYGSETPPIAEEDFSQVTFEIKKDGTAIEFIYNNDGTYTVAPDDYTGTKVTSVSPKQVEVQDSEVPDYKLTIKGLDDGEYTVEETNAPAGYNKVTATVKLEADTGNKQDWSNYETDTLTEIKKTVTINGEAQEGTGNVETGLSDVLIQDRQGAALPSTGGIGTTLFYLGGGAMVAVAGIFLITKKRMGKDEA